MVEREEAVPRSLRDAVLSDLQAVRPLPSPWRLALAIVLPWAAISLLVLGASIGFRDDLTDTGPLSWLAFALLAAAGYALVVLVIRETLPGSAAPRTCIGLAVSVILVSQIALAFLLHASHPTAVPEGEGLRLSAVCAGAMTLLASPLVVGVLLVARRAYCTSPLACGILSGIGTVVAAEAVWRLHCSFTSPLHLVTAHFPPYLWLILLGVLAFRRIAPR